MPLRSEILGHLQTQVRTGVMHQLLNEHVGGRMAVVRYGKGRPVSGEVARKMLRDQRNKGAKATDSVLEKKHSDAPKKKSKKKK